MAVGPDQPGCLLLRRVVPVDKGDFVAMAHGAQRRQKVRTEQRRDSDQHAQTLLEAVVEPMRKRSESGRLAPPSARA